MPATTDIILEDAQQRINETVLKLTIPFLSICDLLAVSVTNHHFSQHVRSRNDVWTSFYHEFDALVENHPFLDESHSCEECEMKRLYMRIPPRIHGEKVDQDLFQPHPLDSAARQHDLGPLLYCIELGTCPYWDIDAESGELLDVFLVEGTSDLVYLHREFPVCCKDCKTWLYSTEDLVEHCRSDAHLFARDPRLIDPRSQESFHELSAFQKTKALTIYPLTVVSVFRDITTSSSSQEVMDVFTSINQHLMRRILGPATGLEAPDVADCTSDVISEFCIDYITDGFFSGDKYALLTIQAGWQPTYGYFLDGLGSYLCSRMSDYLLPDHLKEAESNRLLCMSTMELLGLYITAISFEELSFH